MINNPGNLPSPNVYKGKDKMYMGNGSTLSISYIGNSKLQIYSNSLKLKDVLVVPFL